MRTTVRLPPELLRRAKRVAAASDRTLTELIEEGLRLVLHREREGGERTEPVLPVYGGAGTLPGVDLDDWASVKRLLDEEEAEAARGGRGSA